MWEEFVKYGINNSFNFAGLLNKIRKKETRNQESKDLQKELNILQVKLNLISCFDRIQQKKNYLTTIWIK